MPLAIYIFLEAPERAELLENWPCSIVKPEPKANGAALIYAYL